MNSDRGALERSVARLASERTALFCRSSHSFGLSVVDQGRLKTIERELDETFTSLRRLRAARDVARFAREDPVLRRAIARREVSGTTR
ncbi:MAG: hypothetical protein ACT4OX_15095 [Actinomycetota bacterium]